MCFHGVWRGSGAILVSFSFSVYLSIYIESLRNSGKRRENTSDTHTQGILNYSVRSLYSHTNSYNNTVTQCHVDGAHRAWVTCGVMPRLKTGCMLSGTSSLTSQARDHTQRLSRLITEYHGIIVK